MVVKDNNLGIMTNLNGATVCGGEDGERNTEEAFDDEDVLFP